LCAYLFLRAARLLREPGMAGLIATNTIAQGDTREVGLNALAARGMAPVRAVPSMKWPGEANLEVAEIWFRRGPWSGHYVLGGEQVAGITSQLTRPGRTAGKPHRLAANADKSFQGSIVLGLGFTMPPEDAQALIKRDKRNRDVLFPYLGGTARARATPTTPSFQSSSRSPRATARRPRASASMAKGRGSPSCGSSTRTAPGTRSRWPT